MAVLIIDSDSSSVDVIRDALQAADVKVDVCGDGAEGIRRIQANRPEFIILCVELAKVSGYSICNKIKKDASLASIPLLLISSRATDETFAEHKRLKTRADAYLKKPVDLNELFALLETHVASFHRDLTDLSKGSSVRPEGKSGAPHEPPPPITMDEPPAIIEPPSESFAFDLPSLETSPPEVAFEMPPVEMASVVEPAIPVSRPPARTVKQTLPSPYLDLGLDAISRAPSALMATGARRTSKTLSDDTGATAVVDASFDDLVRTLETLETSDSTDAGDDAVWQARIAELEAKLERSLDDATIKVDREARQRRDLEERLSETEEQRAVLTDKIAFLVDKLKALAAEREQWAKQADEQVASTHALAVERNEHQHAFEQAQRAVEEALRAIDESPLLMNPAHSWTDSEGRPK